MSGRNSETETERSSDRIEQVPDEMMEDGNNHDGNIKTETGLTRNWRGQDSYEMMEDLNNDGISGRKLAALTGRISG